MPSFNLFHYNSRLVHDNNIAFSKVMLQQQVQHQNASKLKFDIFKRHWIVAFLVNWTLESGVSLICFHMK